MKIRDYVEKKKLTVSGFISFCFVVNFSCCFDSLFLCLFWHLFCDCFTLDSWVYGRDDSDGKGASDGDVEGV